MSPTYYGGRRRSERAASLPVFSRECPEAAARRGAERERLRDCLGRRGEQAARREKRVGPRSVRVARPRKSRAARGRFGRPLGMRGERPWSCKREAEGAGGEARRMAGAAAPAGKAAQRRVRAA